MYLLASKAITLLTVMPLLSALVAILVTCLGGILRVSVLVHPSVSQSVTCFYYIPSIEILEFPSVINLLLVSSDNINFHFLP